MIPSAGSIDSPKLLMLSGVGSKHNLKESAFDLIQELPVGKNLQNHFETVPISISVTKEFSSFGIETLHNDVVYLLNSHGGPMSDNAFVENISFLKTSFEEVPNLSDIQVGYLKYKYDDSSTSTRYLLPYFDEFLLPTLHLAPKNRGELKFNSVDPINSPPLIYAKVESSECWWVESH